MKEIKPEEVRKKIEKGECEIIDIRAERQYKKGHIPGAENIPMGELTSEIQQHDWNENEIIVVCPVGQSSRQAGRLIESYEGVNGEVASMEGGYEEWEWELEEE